MAVFEGDSHGQREPAAVVTISGERKRVAMSDVKAVELQCPFRKRYMGQGDVSNLPKHLERDCSSINRDGTNTHHSIASCPIIIDVAPGGGGYGVGVSLGPSRK